jgi:NAD(P)-dependent dehydrogenase (short-subunit alcohol dehydrogenase family)
MTMGKLDGKVALITGGLSGIGRQIARRFGEEGAKVVVMDARTESRDDGMTGDAFVAGLPVGGLFHQGDVTSPEDADRAFAATIEAFGELNVLVNNAGVALFKPVEDIALEEFDLVMAVNVRGTFLMCQRALRQMKRQAGPGTIVNVSSNFAFVAAPEASLYCASKGAVATMTKGIALEAAPFGIRVNALCPGATATEFNRSHRARPEVRDDWKSKTPLDLGRDEFLALPEEIAPSALFLACDDSRYMTGAHLVVDGGWNAQ